MSGPAGDPGVAGDARPPATVLYVEDDASNRSLMTAVFAARLPSVTLHLAASGAEAIAHVAGEMPHLLLVDGHLGDMTADELIPQLRSASVEPLPPVVTVSGDRRPPAAGHAEVVAHVPKPFRVADLVEMLERLLGRGAE